MQYVVVNTDCQLGRHLLYIIPQELRGIRPHLLIAGLACLTMFLAYWVWRGGASLRGRIGMLLALGLGSTMLIPGLGQRIVEFSGLKVSVFDEFPGYSMPMLFSALLTLCLGLSSYCRISGKSTQLNRERVLVAVSCGTFVLMLAWSAPLWRFIPRTEVIQFPWRLCRYSPSRLLAFSPPL